MSRKFRVARGGSRGTWAAIGMLLVAPLLRAGDAAPEFPVAAGPIEPTIASLREYACPDWFRDAKLGIRIAWGAHAVTGQGVAYARNLYVPGTPQYESHVATFGHPSQSGYKDVIARWTAEKFDPGALMDRFADAGARYLVALAADADNFDLWDSSQQRWNSVNFGPKRDLTGAWAEAARARGVRFGVSEHLAPSFAWLTPSHGADRDGPRAGVPYDGADPQYAGLYFPAGSDTNAEGAPGWWQKQWFDRLQDLIDRHQPEIVCTDGGLPFGEVGRRLVAHYYNRSFAWQRDPVVYSMQPNSPDRGEFLEGVGVPEQLRSTVSGVAEHPWQTTLALKNESGGVRTTRTIVHTLADVVSRNGNLLLEPGLLADGTLAPEATQVLGELGAWLRINGEAIFNTRPWRVCGENWEHGVVTAATPANARLTSDDIRFTARTQLVGEEALPHTTIYAIVLGWPGAYEPVTIKSLAEGQPPAHVQTVRMLGYQGALRVQRDQVGLHVQLPDAAASRLAIVLRID